MKAKIFINRLVVGFFILGICFLSIPGVSFAGADDQAFKKIEIAKSSAEIMKHFDELKNRYFKDNNYEGFLKAIKGIKQKDAYINYYIALTRFTQLSYLEKEQKWEEYFDQGTAYRDQIISNLDTVTKSVPAQDVLSLYSVRLLWLFYRSQGDPQQDLALAELEKASLEFSRSASDLEVIKDIADTLLANEEKLKSRQLYKIYVDKLIGVSKNTDSLKDTALSFYSAGNIDFSEVVYDAYLEKLSAGNPKAYVPALMEAIKMFSYNNKGSRYDLIYTEKLFSLLEKAGKNLITEDLTYQRAFNLEKAREYPQAKQAYIDLVSRYPESLHADEAKFKIAVITAYVDSDIKGANTLFGELAEKEPVSNHVVESWYHLGLLSQWEKDYGKAGDWYKRVTAKDKDEFSETMELAQERLKEIEAKTDLEYNLKTFLDLTFKQVEPSDGAPAGHSEIKSSEYELIKAQNVDVVSDVYMSETGCLSVQVNYLWSGNLAGVNPNVDQDSFTTSYPELGTKVIFLVIVTPSGSLDRNIDIVDVYARK